MIFGGAFLIGIGEWKNDPKKEEEGRSRWSFALREAN
jgi:hypothetical protein